MGKRYGRNQKREARLEIERLERARDYWEDRHRAETSILKARLNHAQRDLDNVRDALGPNFIGFTPVEISSRARSMRDDSGFLWPVPGGDLTMQTMALKSFDTSEKADHQLHFRVTLADHSIGYALSVPALLHTPPEFLSRSIAYEMAQQLVLEIRKARRRRGAL